MKAIIIATSAIALALVGEVANAPDVAVSSSSY